MQKFFVLIAVLSAIGEAQAIERIYAEESTCRDIKAVLERDGSAIVLYPSRSIPGLTLIDRFVSAPNFCESARQVKPYGIVTRDSFSCKIAICHEQHHDSSK